MSDRFEKGHACVIDVGGDLPTTVGNAEGLRKILKDPERCAYLDEPVQLLTGKRTARSQIISALKWLAAIDINPDPALAHVSSHRYQILSLWNSGTCCSMDTSPRTCLESRYRAIDLWQLEGRLKVQ
jgi:hypothetical protein